MAIIKTKDELEVVDKFGIGEPNDAYAQYFTGRSYLKVISQPGSGNLFMANVTFEPGCRNFWHIHHAKSGGGQTLICLEGEGWYQEKGKPAVSLTEGSVINIPPNVKHWHGAKENSWFSHIAVEVPGEDTSTEWLNEVTDEQYSRAGLDDAYNYGLEGVDDMSEIKIFIAQPMRYKSDDEIMVERLAIIEKLENVIFKGRDINILNSYMDDFTESDYKNKSLNYLGRSIQLLSEADYVYFAAGWEGARGCHIEHECAEKYGIKIIED